MALDAAARQEVKNIIQEFWQQTTLGAIGVIMSYNPYKNTATVAVTGNSSDNIKETIENVPCPMQMGAQGVDPQPGWLAWIVYRDGRTSSPLITHFYNPMYEDYIYESNRATNSDIPSYMLS